MFELIKDIAAQKKLNISQIEKACGFGNGTIRKWTTQTPSAEKILVLANYLNVSMEYLLTGQEKNSSLNRDELKLLNLYNDLDQNTKKEALVHLAGLNVLIKHNDEFKEALKDVLTLFETSSNSDNCIDLEEDRHSREISIFSQSVSAGTGNFLDSDNYELMEFPVDELPIQTTFGVRITGNSMEPEYFEGDILFVKQQPTVEDGQLGIFMVNGGALFKKYHISDSGVELISLNYKEHPVRKISENDDYRCLGRVIGVHHIRK